MEVERAGDGRWHFSLGLVEKWIVVAFTSAALSIAYWFVGSVNDQGKLLQAVVTQQAVTNAQIGALTTQLADVPGLTRQMAEIQVQIKRNTADIDELRKLRGLK